MEGTTSAKNKQGINAPEIYQYKERNISRWLFVTTSILHSAYSIGSL